MVEGHSRATSLGPAAGMILAAIIVLSSGAPVRGEPTVDEITRALLARGAARAPGDPKLLEQRRLIEALRGRSARSLTLDERERVATFAEEKPHIDLEINFDFDSSAVGPKALPPLLALGRALSKDEFKGTTFLIDGHTDAKGGEAYNQALSERRAEAVKRVLIEQFNLPADTLIAVGFGKTHLKNPADPFGGENRRVQIVNTEVK